MKKIDEALINWEEIKDLEWSALLIGNGFSINIWSKFNYNSLYELSCSGDTDYPLSSSAKKLFNSKDTTNFEEILNLLLGAILADEIIRGGQIEKLQRFYNHIKKALVVAVQFAHIPPGLIDTKYISDELKKYKTVFTTNYDLIPYWSIMEHNTSKFVDYFWNEGCLFDPENVEIWGKCTRILYLHGALHILEDQDKNVFKNTAAEGNLLEQFPNTFKELYSPLFITEGDYKEKLAHIFSSPYLRFAYEELEDHNDSIVLLGHSLNMNYDKHLIDALNKWGRRNIAISVWPRQSNEEIITFKAQLKKHVPNKNLIFYDSTTHPLGGDKLTCFLRTI